MPADHDAGGDRQHVLGRATDLDAANVRGVIGPEGGRAQRLHQVARQPFIPCGKRDGGRQAARHVVGKIRSRQDRRDGIRYGLGDDLGHEAVRAALDALGTGDDGCRRLEVRRKRRRGFAQILRRRRKQDDVRARRLGHVGGDADTRIETHAGQLWILSRRLHLRGAFGASRIQHDFAAGTHRGACERAAICTTADHRDRIKGRHVRTPRACWRSRPALSRWRRAASARGAARPSYRSVRAPSVPRRPRRSSRRCQCRARAAE